MDTSLRLNERTALLTAGCSSIGRALAFRLSELGAHVAMVDGPSKGGDRIVEEILNMREVHDKRGKAAFFQATYADSKAMLESVGRAAENFGGLDILVDFQLLDVRNNFEEFRASNKKLSEFDEYLLGNTKTSLMLTQKALDIFKIRKKGRIIFLTQEMQVSGLDKDGPTRKGILEFTKSLAREFTKEQVTVNAVSVGATEEYLLRRFPTAKSIQAAHQELFKTNPEIKMTDANEVANVVAFLASPLASGVTGQCISAANSLSLMS